MKWKSKFHEPGFEFCSNMYKASINVKVNGETITFPASENYYQAKKFLSLAIWKEFAAATPYATKALAKQKMIDNPDMVKSMSNDELVESMYKVLVAKFTQHPELLKKLKALPKKELVETNNWCDQFWGNCICNRRPSCMPKGKNHLGKLLQRIQEEL